MDIRESDWKVFRRLHSIALERYCQRILEEVRLTAACNDSYHDCYLKVFRLIRDRDKTMAAAFDNPVGRPLLCSSRTSLTRDCLPLRNLSNSVQTFRAGSRVSSYQVERFRARKLSCICVIC
jgi:hypothetical protein